MLSYRVLPSDLDDDDLSPWLRMRSRLWPHCCDAYHRREMGEWLDSKECCCILALEGDKAVGFVEGRIRDVAEDCKSSPVGYVEGWFVEASHRAKGIGKALMDALEAWFAERSCREMASDTELGNELSCRAHAAAGFEESSRLIHFRKDIEPLT